MTSQAKISVLYSFIFCFNIASGKKICFIYHCWGRVSKPPFIRDISLPDISFTCPHHPISLVLSYAATCLYFSFPLCLFSFF